MKKSDSRVVKRKGVCMRRLFILLCCSVAFLILVTACENKENPEIQQLGEKFIKEVYSVDDPNIDTSKMSTEQLIEAQNKFSTYFTEKEFKDLATIRFFLIPLELADKQNSTISVQSIAFKKSNREQEKGDPLNFDHSFSLIFTDQEGNKVEEVEIKGQISFVDTENGLKIDRYYDGKTLKNMLYR